MNIHPQSIKVIDVIDGFKDGGETGGVVAYHGLLNVRPKYQRNFCYDVPDEQKVIRSILNGWPLNVMYWVKNPDGTFEILDGQQRTLSICNFCGTINEKGIRNGSFLIVGADGKQYNFQSLTKEDQDKILNYELTIYVCEGTEKEKLEWFQIINMVGKQLTPQERRNAIYTGPWLSDAKRYFSATASNPAKSIGDPFVKADANRQEYLETAIAWAAGCSTSDSAKIEAYMAKHRNDENASELWQYFCDVIDWIKKVFSTGPKFPNYRREMKGLDWGQLYLEFSDCTFQAEALEKDVAALMLDDEVTKKSGIYEYALLSYVDPSNRSALSLLNLRTFSEEIRRKKYDEQGGICPKCGKHFDISEMDADHITPWIKGGKTMLDNCQMLCKSCNRSKGAK